MQLLHQRDHFQEAVVSMSPYAITLDQISEQLANQHQFLSSDP